MAFLRGFHADIQQQRKNLGQLSKRKNKYNFVALQGKLFRIY